MLQGIRIQSVYLEIEVYSICIPPFLVIQYTLYIYRYTPICIFFHVYSPVHEICAPAAGRECEVWEHKNNPQVVSGTIVPMDPHMLGVQPQSFEMSLS